MRIPDGPEVFPGYVHSGAARRLVHRLKYGGITDAGEVFVAGLAELIPAGTRALIPVPRSTFRRVKYGIDPAMALARLLKERTGLIVAPVLRAPLWWPAHAGSGRSTRKAPGFVVVGRVPRGSVLVDDVVTTGGTLVGAAHGAGVGAALTATRAGRDASG